MRGGVHAASRVEVGAGGTGGGPRIAQAGVKVKSFCVGRPQRGHAGQMDDVQLYNVALTAAAVTNLYASYTLSNGIPVADSFRVAKLVTGPTNLLQ